MTIALRGEDANCTSRTSQQLSDQQSLDPPSIIIQCHFLVII